MSDEAIEYLLSFKARAVVANPPELSFLRILVPPQSLRLPPPYMDLDSGRISSTDKNLLTLYAGGYRGPGSSLLGGYLIYDATKDSLSVIPRLPNDLHGAMGHQSAVVMCDPHGEGYLLAELVLPQFCRAGVWLWRSSAPEPEWVLLPGSHPLPSSTFKVDSCFSYRGSILCWVDLLRGMLLCDLLHQADCNNMFRFIKLPQECLTYDDRYPNSVRPEESRSMDCVSGHIKLIAMDECGSELIVWTLSADLSGWTITSRYNVQKIWANVNYRSAGLRQLAPLFPVLSIHEDGVVYLVVNDESIVDDRLEHKGQYLLRVDMGEQRGQHISTAYKAY